MSLRQGTRLGPYEILAPLGAGGMGEVYKARDTRLGREVAVKVLPSEFAADPERLRRFEQEARAAAALNHPEHPRRSYDIGTHDGTPYIVERTSRRARACASAFAGPTAPGEGRGLGVQIAQGLAAAHEKGIVHRDLKPENLFVTKDGRVKILDFGLARLRPEGPRSRSHDRGAHGGQPHRARGRFSGTPGYMSPEQVRGRPVDARTDIFAFGVVLYEMLAGKRAFEGATQSDVTAAILKEDPPPLPRNIPLALTGIVRECLEKRSEDRFSTAHDLALALQANSGTSQSGVAPGVSGWAGRNRVAIGATCALLLAAVLAVAFFWHPWKAQPSKPGVAATSAPSLVALPCKVLGSPESAYLTDAIPSTISTLLGEVQGIDTKIPPTSFEVEKVTATLTRLPAPTVCRRSSSRRRRPRATT